MKSIQKNMNCMFQSGEKNNFRPFTARINTCIKNGRAVKKTLTIPEWLNEAAIQQNINFSQVLQDALMQRIGISCREGFFQFPVKSFCILTFCKI